MSHDWNEFHTRLAKGETVEEIVKLNETPEKPEQSKLFKVNVKIGGMNYDLKPMVPTLEQIPVTGLQQQKNKELIVPSPSIPVSQFLPLSDDDQDVDVEEDNISPLKAESYDKEEEKNKIEELWSNFKKGTSKQEKRSSQSEINGKQENNTVSTTDVTSSKPSEKASIRSDSDTVTITKVYDFAGEEVKVTKEVKRDSAEAISHFKEQSNPVPSRGILGRSAIGGSLKKKAGGGIGNVLGRLGKKPKLSTLEKSKLDWKQYKEEEGIEEELQAYNKGKEGYLEKVSFLERTEIRQFERERDIRLKQSSKR